MAIRYLTQGSAERAPLGAVRIRLSASSGAELELRDEAGERVAPQFQPLPTSLVIVPAGRTLTVGTRPVGAEAFGSAIAIGATFDTPSGIGDEIVLRPVDVGGRSWVPLAKISGQPPRIESAYAGPATITNHLGQSGTGGEATTVQGGAASGMPLTPREWHRTGSYAYHRHHDVAIDGDPWALVLDSSAALLAQDRRAGVVGLIHLLVGVMAAATSSGPTAVVKCAFPQPAEVSSLLDAEAPAWNDVLGELPSPWARVGGGIELAADATRWRGTLVLASAGVPVDVEGLVPLLTRLDGRLIVVALGESPWEVSTAARPSEWWRNELSGFEGLAQDPKVTIVSVGDLAAVADQADAIASALYPARRPT